MFRSFSTQVFAVTSQRPSATRAWMRSNSAGSACFGHRIGGRLALREVEIRVLRHQRSIVAKSRRQTSTVSAIGQSQFMSMWLCAKVGGVALGLLGEGRELRPGRSDARMPRCPVVRCQRIGRSSAAAARSQSGAMQRVPRRVHAEPASA